MLTIYTLESAASWGVYVIAIWAVEFHSVNSGKIRSTTRHDNRSSTVDSWAMAKLANLVFFTLAEAGQRVYLTRNAAAYHGLESRPSKDISLMHQAVKEFCRSFDERYIGDPEGVFLCSAIIRFMPLLKRG